MKNVEDLYQVDQYNQIEMLGNTCLLPEGFIVVDSYLIAQHPDDTIIFVRVLLSGRMYLLENQHSA